MSNQFDQPSSSTGGLTSGPISGIAQRSAIFEQFETITCSDYWWFYGFALRISKNHHDAEDAVQEAFLAAYRHLDELKSTQKLGPWIASIVLNCARMQYRVKNRFAFSFDEEMNVDSDTRLLEKLRDTSTSPEDRYAVLELYAKLNRFIASLSSKLRPTFLLRRVKGLTTAETAEALCIPQRLVRLRLSRASARMTKLLARHIAGAPRRSTCPEWRHESRDLPSGMSTLQLPHTVPDQFNEAIHFLPPVTWHETQSREHQ
jgi:RNA polymerase sigma-70 factor (ECF subfamily)